MEDKEEQEKGYIEQDKRVPLFSSIFNTSFLAIHFFEATSSVSDSLLSERTLVAK